MNHIDTSDYYGPHVTNEIIREALHPYPDGLVIVTKVGARRTAGRRLAARRCRPDELRQAVHDNLDHLGLDALDVVNLRMPGFAEPVGAVARRAVRGARRAAAAGADPAPRREQRDRRSRSPRRRRSPPIVCVQNHYNLAHRRRRPADRRAGRARASPTCRSFRSAASPRCSRRRCRPSRTGWRRRRCRWRWPGCSSARRTSC